MRFLVDNQLPAALARFLASRGVECQHVLDVDLGEATDVEIWEHASRNDCVVISKDEDFLSCESPFGECTSNLDSFGELPHESAASRGRTLVAEDRGRVGSRRANHRASLNGESKAIQETRS